MYVTPITTGTIASHPGGTKGYRLVSHFFQRLGVYYALVRSVHPTSSDLMIFPMVDVFALLLMHMMCTFLILSGKNVDAKR